MKLEFLNSKNAGPGDTIYALNGLVPFEVRMVSTNVDNNGGYHVVYRCRQYYTDNRIDIDERMYVFRCYCVIRNEEELPTLSNNNFYKGAREDIKSGVWHLMQDYYPLPPEPMTQEEAKKVTLDSRVRLVDTPQSVYSIRGIKYCDEGLVRLKLRREDAAPYESEVPYYKVCLVK